MKRNIRAFWLEITHQRQVRAVILRDRRNLKKIPIYVYLPTPSSLKRINRVARGVVIGAFSSYECEPIDDNKVAFGWVLNRKMDTVYPPPDNHVVWYKKPPCLGTQNAGQRPHLVPNEATTP